MNKLYKLTLPNLLMLLSLISSSLFISFGWLFGASTFAVSSPSMRQAMSQVSQETMLTAMEREIPYLRFREAGQNAPPKPYSLFFFETLTNLSPTDLRSLLGRELPGLAQFKAEALALGANVNLEHYVIESAPPVDFLDHNGTGLATDDSSDDAKETTVNDDQPPKVYIYNTHNTESWTHATNNQGVTDKEINITLVSQRLGEELEKRGVKTIVESTDHQQILEEQGLAYALSYAVSLKSVQEAMARDDQIRYIFDIHRDATTRDKSTAVIDGKSYARPYFVIGKRNPHWEQNARLANQFHERLEEKYPGLSIGVFAKGEGHGEYNQSVSPNSILIEVGGIENTLEECYNTTVALAEAFADIYFNQDQKVDAPTETRDRSM